MKVGFSSIANSGVVPAAMWYDYRDDNLEFFGLRGQWDGTSFPPNTITWKMYQAIATGSNNNNDPNACW